jgi:Tfp pilus assembly protein PilN
MRPINLLPPEAFRKLAARRKAGFYVVLGILYVAALVVGTLWWNSRVDSAQEALADQQSINSGLTAEVNTMATADDLASEYAEEVLLTSVVLAQDVAWGRLLNDFGRLIPERVWLDSFVGTSTAGSIPGIVGRVSVAGSGFDFRDVSAWLRSLDDEQFPGLVGAWITSASELGSEETGESFVNFDSSTGLTDAAVSNRLEERIPLVVPG